MNIIEPHAKNEYFGFEKGGRKEYDAAAKLVFSEICALGGYDYPLTPDGNKSGAGDGAKE